MAQVHLSGGNGHLGSAIVGALDWWREAGVDLDFADAAQTWLPPAERPDRAGPAPTVVATAQAPVAPPPPIGGDPGQLPTTLAGFRDWWLNEPSLDAGQLRDRVAPRGEPGAALMVIVAQPEAEDGPILLSGREGHLLEAILAAAGVKPDDIYLASALTRHTPLPDWDALAGRGLGRILAHHIGLAAPQRVMVFGAGVLSLIGHDPAQNAQPLRVFEHDGATIPLLAARELGALLARPAWKAGFWRSWLDWTGTI